MDGQLAKVLVVVLAAFACGSAVALMVLDGRSGRAEPVQALPRTDAGRSSVEVERLVQAIEALTERLDSSGLRVPEAAPARTAVAGADGLVERLDRLIALLEGHRPGDGPSPAPLARPPVGSAEQILAPFKEDGEVTLLRDNLSDAIRARTLWMTGADLLRAYGVPDQSGIVAGQVQFVYELTDPYYDQVDFRLQGDRVVAVYASSR